MLAFIFKKMIKKKNMEKSNTYSQKAFGIFNSFISNTNFEIIKSYLNEEEIKLIESA